MTATAAQAGNAFESAMIFLVSAGNSPPIRAYTSSNMGTTTESMNATTATATQRMTMG